MKKVRLIILALAISSVSLAQLTDAQLTTNANVIKNETVAGANSATRVGNMFLNLVSNKMNSATVGTSSTFGVTKLYTDVAASNTDGAATQAALVTALNLKANIALTAWANLTYTAPWVTQNYVAKYRKNNFGEVALTGEVWTNGTVFSGSNGEIGILPVGFRPSQELRYPLNCFNGSARILGLIIINTDGTVVMSSATGTAISSVNLDHVRFYTD